MELDFGSKTLWVLNIGGVEVWITETIVNTWAIMLVLIAAAVVVRIKLKSFKAIPAGLQNVVETIVEMFDKFLIDAAGERLAVLGNWFFAVFAFIFVSNISGLFAIRPPTADWVTTFALALATFILIHVVSFKYKKLGHFKSFIEPHPAFLPLNLLGELSKPVSLSFRLFGNVLGGMILLALIYALAPLAVRFVVPSVLHAYFDLFSGAIQTYIFCVLSLTFINLSSSD